MDVMDVLVFKMSFHPYWTVSFLNRVTLPTYIIFAHANILTKETNEEFQVIHVGPNLLGVRFKRTGRKQLVFMYEHPLYSTLLFVFSGVVCCCILCSMLYHQSTSFSFFRNEESKLKQN